jgi:hypothetical protein
MFMRVLLVLATLIGPSSSVRADDGDDDEGSASPAAAGSGPSRVTWPLPADADFDREFVALARRQGFRVGDGDAARVREKFRAAAPGGSDEPTYELYVPPGYEPGRPYGLFVWISAGPEGRVPEQWTEVLDKHHLIAVGPNHVGNDRPVLWRTYLALEAVRHARRHFTIDDERVYVSGVSGGGRIASHAAVLGADTFTGGFYVVGCNFWKDVPAGEGGKFYEGFWKRPDARTLKKARATNRYVLLTGSADGNRVNTKCVYDGYVKDKFAHVEYIEVPGMGHTIPDAGRFEEGIEFLDSPLAPPETLYEQAAAFEKRKKLGDAGLAYARAAVRGAGRPFADDAWARARELRRGYDGQVERVRRLIDEGKLEKAVNENAVLKQRYGPMALQQVRAFIDEIKAARSAR